MAMMSRLWKILPNGETEFIRENEVTTADILRSRDSFTNRVEEDETMVALSVGGRAYTIEADAEGNLVAEWYDFAISIFDEQKEIFDSVESLCKWLDAQMDKEVAA